MSPALATFLFETANLLLLVAVLGRLLFAPVRRALTAEQEGQETARQESARLRAEAGRLVQEARQARVEADHAVEEQRAQILSAARQQAAALLEKARATQRAERDALRAELATVRTTEVATLADAVGRFAAEAVRRLLETLDGPSLDGALVRGACAELEALPADARTSAVVESARRLDDDSRRLLRAVLGDAFEERVVGDLGAGVRVTTTAGQVDATAVALARHAGRSVHQAPERPPSPPIADRSHG